MRPSRWIPLLQKTPETLRSELEKVFQQEKLKDDVTLMAVAVDISLAFDPEIELAKLQASLERLEKEQGKLRAEISRTAVPPARLEKMEKELEEVSQQIKKAAGRFDESRQKMFSERRHSAQAEDSGRPKPFPWLPVVVALLSGLILGLAFFLFSRPREAAVPVQKAPVETSKETRAVRPPEILTPEDCTVTAVRGDTLEKIARSREIPLEVLLQWNPSIPKGAALKPGQKINLCAGER